MAAVCCAATCQRVAVGTRGMQAGSTARRSAWLMQSGARPMLATPRQLQSAAAPRQLRVRAGWGMPVEFKGARVLDSQREAEQLHRIRLELGGAASEYTLAGQYIQAKSDPEGKIGFFAIASPPGADKENGVIELLVKAAGEAAEQVVAAQPGEQVLVSAPQGRGFPIDRIPADRFDTVLCFATGSGISPIRALLEGGALRQRKRVVLYYGARNLEHLAYAASIPAWEAAGIEVVPVFSGEGQGYVQDVFARDGASTVADWSRTAAVLCGHKSMAEAVTQLLTNKGVDKQHILMNF